MPLAGLPSCLGPPVGQCNPVVGSGSVWAPMGGRIVRQPLIGSQPGPITFPLEGRLWDISYGNDAVWVLSGDSLVRLDPNGGKRRNYPLAGEPAARASSRSTWWRPTMRSGWPRTR